MRYSIEPRDRIYVKGYGFLSFAKNMGKSLSNKYGQKLLDSAKKSTTDAIKTASKRAIQKTAEATGDLIGNKIAGKSYVNAKDIGIVMPMYSLIEYSDIYLKTSGSLWKYYKDDPNDNIADSESFKSKAKITGKPPDNGNIKYVKIIVPLKI